MMTKIKNKIFKRKQRFNMSNMIKSWIEDLKKKLLEECQSG